MKAPLITALLTVCILPAPVLADPTAAPPTISATAALSTAGVAAIDPATDTRRVCAVYPVTGSLIMRKVCRTRGEWIALGVDPLARR